MSHAGFGALIAQLPCADQHVITWLPLVRLHSGVFEITFGLIQWPFQPCTPELPLKHGLYESFGPVTDGIPLPTLHPLWPLQTLSFSVVEKHHCTCKIASVHHLVLRGIDQSGFVGWQVERIHIMPGLLPSPLYQRLFPLHFSHHR